MTDATGVVKERAAVVDTPRMSRLRHVMPLLASFLLICMTGGLAVVLTTQAGDKAESVHLHDRQALQATLGSLGHQYVLFSLKEGLDYASSGTWNLRPDDPADTARLRTFVTHAVLLNYGAALVDLSAHRLSSYDSGQGLPPASDPGYAPMVRDLLAQKPDVSSVMTVGGIHVVAMGVPVTVNGVVAAVFVGYVRLDTSALETYVRTLRYGRTGATYVVDSTGTVVASSNASRIGSHYPEARARRDIAQGRSVGFLDSRRHLVIADSPFGIGGWGGVTEQSVAEFYGPLQSGHLRVELAIVALLAMAALVVLALNHKRESARRRFQAQIAYQAAHDDLTGCFNRSVFHERVSQALSRARRLQSDLAVLYLDLDRFKHVNDTMGHDAGDVVLAEVARRLDHIVRAEDTVSRMGGDEFAILVEDATGPTDLEPMARRIVEDVRRPVVVGDTEVVIGISVGIAYSGHGVGVTEDLVRQADVAMYRAKDAGGSRHEWAPILSVVG